MKYVSTDEWDCLVSCVFVFSRSREKWRSKESERDSVSFLNVSESRSVYVYGEVELNPIKKRLLWFQCVVKN